jgi:hypothetical protein
LLAAEREIVRRTGEMLWDPDAIVDIELLPRKAGGRSGPTPATFLGCPFGIDGEYFDCRLDFSDTGPVSPGTKARVPVTFLSPSLVIPRLRSGAAFTLWEGKTIGHGQVVEIRRTLENGAV